MGEKEKILSKFNIKDYRNDLEFILENKDFDEEAKSLLLSIFYKLDNFYKDYSTVKKDSEIKSKFLEDYIKIIKEKCNKIHILAPQECTKTKKYTIDIAKGEIKTFPNEIVLLYALYELAEHKLKNDETNFTNKCVIDMLNKGKTINSTEPIRDFNGWSWTVEINDPKNIEYNLIFQNVLILFGYNFINENMNKNNIIEILKKRISNELWKEKGIEFIECLLQISIILYNNKSLKNHEECIEYKKSISKNMNIFKNRKEYINSMTKSSSAVIKEIEKIDITLNDINLIRKEFENSVEQGNSKYFCISDLVEQKEKERQSLLKQLENNNKLLSPKEFLKNEEGWKNTLDLYDVIKEEQKKVNIQSKIIKLQKLFLECMKLKIQKNENKKDLYNIVSELRYYANIPYKKYKSITMHEKISELFNNVCKIAIIKMLEYKIIDLGFTNKNLNYEIIKYIFKTKIMKLENIILKIQFVSKNQIEIGYYDGNMLEYKQNIEIPFDEELINTKLRKVKLFKTVS